MPRPTHTKITLSADEHQQLSALVHAHKTPQQCSFRAQIILMLAQGDRVTTVAKRLGTSRRTV